MSRLLVLGFILSVFALSSGNSLTELRVKKLERKLNHMAKELEELKKECKPKNTNDSSLHRGARAGADPFVAFSASIVNDITPISANEVINYATTYTNVGGAYDPYIGRFRANVAGYYHFVATVISDGAHYIDIELMKGGSVICKARASETYNAMGTCASTIHLDLDTDVWVRHAGSSGDLVYGRYYPSFTGFLIRAD